MRMYTYYNWSTDFYALKNVEISRMIRSRNRENTRRKMFNRIVWLAFFFFYIWQFSSSSSSFLLVSETLKSPKTNQSTYKNYELINEQNVHCFFFLVKLLNKLVCFITFFVLFFVLFVFRSDTQWVLNLVRISTTTCRNLITITFFTFFFFFKRFWSFML